MEQKLTQLNPSCRDGRLVWNKTGKSNTVILIFPGGGYHHLSARESGPVADKFSSFGYDTAILYYSVAPFENQLPLTEADTAVDFLKREYEKIVVLGFSAGGHLAGMVMTGRHQKDISAAVLCYPVISFVTPTHQGTLTNFLNPDDSEESRKKYSVQLRICKENCPVFVWATRSDNAVPVSNSDLLIEACREKGVPVDSVFFDHGPHGMALADETAIKDGDTSYMDKEVATWPEQAKAFLDRTLK